MVMLNFALFDWTNLDKFHPKNQNFQFRVKFGTKNNSNMYNSMVVFTFSVFDQNFPFRASLFWKFKIDYLK